MKKLMMGTAIALLSTTAAVQAQEWSVDVGGVFVGGLGYIDIDDGNDDIGLVRDPEVIVIARLVADNGVTFGVRTEIEGADSGETIDENYMFITGAFGEIEFGEADGAMDRYQYFGYVQGPWAAAGDGVGFLFDGAYYAGDTGNRLNSVGLETSDALKVSYYTPEIAGFSAGASYVPDADEQQSRRSQRNDGGDAYEVGAGYEGDFAGFTLGAGIGYSEAPQETESLSGGLKAGFGGFELGVTYSDNENIDGDQQTIQAGLSYSTGPWTFGGDYATELDSSDGEEQAGAAIGVSYALAPGVSVGLGGEYHDADTDLDESIAVGTWLGLRF